MNIGGDQAYKAFLEHKAYKLRVNSLRATTQAGSGHPTSCLSAADIVAALFFYAMRYDPYNYTHPDNDRFILSKGHAAPLLYAAWHEVGVISDEELMSLRQFNSSLEGHPTPRFPYVQAATGSLGQGLSIGLGISLAARLQQRTFYTYVLLGDSEITEGSIWEAAEIAAYYTIGNLIVILDNNRFGQANQVIWNHDVERYQRMWSAFGWYTFIINGHSIPEIIEALDKAKQVRSQPSIIIAKTYKGYGVDRLEDQENYHGHAVKKEELPAMLNQLKHRFWAASQTTRSYSYTWHPTHFSSQEQPIEARNSFQDEIPLPAYTQGQMLATRKAYGQSLAILGNYNKKIIALDAEVKNSTFAEIFEKEHPDRFIECFIAEQNMVSMAIGLCSQGFIPFVSTFAAFFTRAFDQLRMSAISRAALRVVGSHAGVSVGADGPSQMGLEDIALMRLLPNAIVLYPSDAVSTYKLICCMIQYTQGISYLRTTRAETPVIYHETENFYIGGCKVLKHSDHDRVVVIAAGITLFEALAAYERLRAENIFIAVIDLYSVQPLDVKTVQTVAENGSNKIITTEDHYVAGGIGEAVRTALAHTNISVYSCAVQQIPRSGTSQELLAYEEINADALIKLVKRIIR